MFDGALKVVEVVLALGHLIPHVALEAALQQVVGERAEQVFHAHFAGGVGDVFAVADAFHKGSFQPSAVSHQVNRSNLTEIPYRSVLLAVLSAWLFLMADG